MTSLHAAGSPGLDVTDVTVLNDALRNISGDVKNMSSEINSLSNTAASHSTIISQLTQVRILVYLP